MSSKNQTIYLAAALLMSSALSVAQGSDPGSGDQEAELLHMPTNQNAEIIRQTPMPELGDGRLAKILTRYYREGLGGAENWDQISSLQFTGNLKLKNGDFELSAFQRKPNLIKMTIRANQSDLVLAYDGETAWQQLPGRNTKAEAMGVEEARRFTHSANFGSHLLYPFTEGKKIEFIDTVPVEGSICHQIRVTLLDTEYQVDYFIDIRTYLEVKVVSTDLRNQTSNSVVYKDYIRESGMPIAKHVESFENGEWFSSLQLDNIKLNSGVIPWMFEMRD